jgi:threonine/homoserine/homoserine lactone efflux protein
MQGSLPEDGDVMAIGPVVTALGVGLALAGAPGPVQAVLLGESIRGGVRRGFRALAGAHVTFGALLASLALGLSVATPRGTALRMLKVAGGAFLLWLAVDALRTRGASSEPAGTRRLPAGARGALAILLNPGGWLFLAAVAAPLLATATERGGSGSAVLAAAALVAGAAAGDAAVVILGGLGLSRAGDRVLRLVTTVLALVLAALGVSLVASGVIG